MVQAPWRCLTESCRAAIRNSRTAYASRCVCHRRCGGERTIHARRPSTRTAQPKPRIWPSSFEKGYIRDALRYLTIAHENDPVDFDVMLKLGWANNLLKDDREAIKGFNLAPKSP